MATRVQNPKTAYMVRRLNDRQTLWRTDPAFQGYGDEASEYVIVSLGHYSYGDGMAAVPSDAEGTWLSSTDLLEISYETDPLNFMREAGYHVEEPWMMLNPAGRHIACGDLPAKQCRQLQHVYESAVGRGFNKKRAAQQAWSTVNRTMESNPKSTATYYRRGGVERTHARRGRVGAIKWHEGYSENSSSGHQLQPWMTKAEARADAKARGLRAVFVEDQQSNPKAPTQTPTVATFLIILLGHLTQQDRRESKSESKRGRPNIYRLGHYFAAKQRVEEHVQGLLNSSDPVDIEAVRRAIYKEFLPDFPPAKKTVKAIDEYLASGKRPKYPVEKNPAEQQTSGRYAALAQRLARGES